MTGRQIIDLAKTSQLEQLAKKDDDATILGYLNLGLIELYKRFPLKVEEYLIELVDGQTIYTLPAGCMYLTAAYGEVEENSERFVATLPINEEDDPLSINTISWNKVQIPVSVSGAYISLIYVANPTWIDLADIGEEVELPLQLVEAMLCYIGYMATAALGAEEPENNIHYQRFEASCKRAETLGITTRNDVAMTERINMRGFV